jgi:transcription initiation factor TFIIE subunit beta
MWSEIPIPDETDLPKALEVAGLKTMEVFEKKVTSEVKICSNNYIKSQY